MTMSTMATEHPVKLIDATTVGEMYGIHEKVVFKWAKLGKIPKSHTNRRGYTRWLYSDVVEHIAKMKETEAQEAAA
jgi:predicted DNA-binding transcriptional regulator AlpA